MSLENGGGIMGSWIHQNIYKLQYYEKKG